jgi:hypothetical protein
MAPREWPSIPEATRAAQWLPGSSTTWTRWNSSPGQAGLPEAFEIYRRRLEREGAAGDRKFVAVLRMASELGVDRVAAALSKACALGSLDPADIRLSLIRESEAPASGLCTPWTMPSGLVAPSVVRPPLSDYAGLLAGAAL